MFDHLISTVSSFIDKTPHSFSFAHVQHFSAHWSGFDGMETFMIGKAGGIIRVARLCRLYSKLAPGPIKKLVNQTGGEGVDRRGITVVEC